MTKSIRIKRAVAGIGLGLAGSVGGLVLAGVPAANAAVSGHNSYSCPNAPEGSGPNAVIFTKTEALQWLIEGAGPCTNTVTGKPLTLK